MVSGSPRVRPCHLDRIDVTDEVADAGVRGGELLAVPLAGVPPGDGQVITELAGEPAAPRAGGRVGVVVDLAARDGRGPLVEQPGQRADQPRLTLAAFPEQDDVVPGDQRALEVRQDGLAEPDDAGERILPGPHHGEQVLPDLFLNAAVFVPAGAQLTEGGGGRRAAAGVGRFPPTRVWTVGAVIWLHYSTLCRHRGCSHTAQVARHTATCNS